MPILVSTKGALILPYTLPLASREVFHGGTGKATGADFSAVGIAVLRTIEKFAEGQSNVTQLVLYKIRYRRSIFKKLFSGHSIASLGGAPAVDKGKRGLTFKALGHVLRTLSATRG